MIERVTINSIKRFERLHCDLAQHLVVVGPNGCGKTTLLQAIALWSELGWHWSQYNRDLSRETDGEYPSSDMSVLKVSSIPLVDWDHLWPKRDVGGVASIRLRVDGKDIGFELLYQDRNVVHVRPTKDVSEQVLDEYMQTPVIPIYVPPMSGVELHEPPYQRTVIPARLARGQGGTVLRNVLLGVSGDDQRWDTLRKVVLDLFGYELTRPSAGAEILAGYREESGSLSLDFGNAAAGFLQVLMIYATMLYRPGGVMMIDEPDAHLHVALQERLYRDLRDRCRREGWQLIMATHSERIVREADAGAVRVLMGELRRVRERRQALDALQVDSVELWRAQEVGRILYVEGKTDVEMLRAWARVLDHPTKNFLEQGFWKAMAEDRWKADRHFQAMRLNAPTMKGVELRDRNEGRGETRGDGCPEGMTRQIWEQYEIENYLIQPRAVLRWLADRASTESVRRAEEYMTRRFPPALYDEPFGADYFNRKGKSVLREVCEAANVRVDDVEFQEIAKVMRRGEIHPEVVEKLNGIAQQLDLKEWSAV